MSTSQPREKGRFSTAPKKPRNLAKKTAPAVKKTVTVTTPSPAAAAPAGGSAFPFDKCGTCGQFAASNHQCPTTATVDTATAPSAGVELSKEELREARLNAAETELVTAVESLKSEKDWQEAIAFAASIHQYSLSNSIMLYTEHKRRREIDPENTPASVEHFASFGTWKENERSVMKGEKGYPILAPNKAKVRVAVFPDGSQKILYGNNPVPPGAIESTGTMVTGFRVTHTFADYQTDGKPIPKRQRPKFIEGEGIPRLTEATEQVIKESGYTVEYRKGPLPGGANGYTDPVTKEVVVDSTMPPAQQQKTLIHEWGHIANGHTADGFDYQRHRGHAEVQAEATAYYTVRAIDPDIPVGEYSTSYVAGWSNGMSARDISKSLSGVSTGAQKIIAAFDALTGTEQ